MITITEIAKQTGTSKANISYKNKRFKLKSIEPFNVVKDTTNIYEPSSDEDINTAIDHDTGAVYTVEGYQASGYIEIIRGTPLLLQMLILYAILAPLIGKYIS